MNHASPYRAISPQLRTLCPLLGCATFWPCIQAYPALVCERANALFTGLNTRAGWSGLLFTILGALYTAVLLVGWLLTLGRWPAAYAYRLLAASFALYGAASLGAGVLGIAPRWGMPLLAVSSGALLVVARQCGCQKSAPTPEAPESSLGTRHFWIFWVATAVLAGGAQGVAHMMYLAYGPQEDCQRVTAGALAIGFAALAFYAIARPQTTFDLTGTLIGGVAFYTAVLFTGTLTTGGSGPLVRGLWMAAGLFMQSYAFIACVELLHRGAGKPGVLAVWYGLFAVLPIVLTRLAELLGTLPGSPARHITVAGAIGLFGIAACSLAGLYHLYRTRDTAMSTHSDGAFVAECLRSIPVNPPASLSQRECEVAALAARGYSAQKIAEVLGVSRNTVNCHLGRIYHKLGIHSKQELIAQREELERLHGRA